MPAHRIFAALAVALCSMGAGATPSASPTTPPLDYSRTLEQSSMVFVPYEGMANRGPLFFKQYTQVSLGPVSIGDGFRHLSVNLTPTAVVQGQYIPFLNQHNIIDVPTALVPTYGTCQPTQAIKDYLSFMPEEYRPTTSSGGYPEACVLSLYYLDVVEQQVLARVAAGPVMTLNASVPLCAPNSPRLEVNAINQALRTRGVLQVSSSGVWTGNHFRLLYESVLLSQSNPSLFGTANPEDGWTRYIKLFQVDATTSIATMSAANAQQRPLMCVSQSLIVTYGTSTPAP
ncbi:hypothetical protein LXT21_29350 [Myxococcus sp. K38C18041901]|uniref:hypothetical protein n=1 Tax=Myxococcus guangdongensis TaxID=2906760 RepID=UPI0020A725B3|nr:hypothetical protein [Myxococcus guangdongensis]MCP3062899.1 hypothetical protein [Myxococcus guangdongensis]